jgi:hypothetical protein
MTYKILADFILLIHFLWILFLFFGAYIGARVRVLRILHLSGLAFALITEIFGWYCPLTYLEVWLDRSMTPIGVYRILHHHYVEKIVYLNFPDLIV